MNLRPKLEQMRASVVQLQRDVEEILTLLAQPKILPVPWVSQLGQGADYAPGDCGPAALAAWLRYATNDHSITPDEVSANVNLPRGYRYTMPAHIIRAAWAWSVDLYWRRGLTLDDLRAEIDRGQPVIVLVHYPALGKRFDLNYSSGHWLLIVGYDGDAFYYHDPYWWNAGDGGAIRATAEELGNAWNTNHLDGNSNAQALRMR